MYSTSAKLSLHRTFSDILEDQLLVNYNDTMNSNSIDHATSYDSVPNSSLDYSMPNTMLLDNSTPNSNSSKSNTDNTILNNVFNQYADPSLTTQTNISNKINENSNTGSPIVQTISLSKLLKSSSNNKSTSKQSQLYSKINFNSNSSNNNSSPKNNEFDTFEENNNILFTQNNSLYDDEFNLFLAEQHQILLNNSKENLLTNSDSILQDNNVLLDNENAKTSFNNEFYKENNNNIDDDILSDDEFEEEEVDGDDDDENFKNNRYFENADLNDINTNSQNTFSNLISNDNAFALQSFVDSNVKDLNSPSFITDSDSNSFATKKSSIGDDDLNDTDIYDFSRLQNITPNLNTIVTQNKNNKRRKSFVKKNTASLTNVNSSTVLTNVKQNKINLNGRINLDNLPNNKIENNNKNSNNNNNNILSPESSNISSSPLSSPSRPLASYSSSNSKTITAIAALAQTPIKKDTKAQTTSVRSTHTHVAGEDHEVFKCMIMNLITNEPCSAEFSRPYDLTRHQNTIHAKRKIVFRCSECIRSLGDDGFKKTFSRLDALTRHIKSKHEDLSMEEKKQVTKYAKQNIAYAVA
ncbi:hypothetical protein TPHA_0H00790 [Tetrapisispora phaffii CBS 4417]|uniref:C2H2-type domain-containing protein n=1 Tax=Tetrapisispora phaffii (strain ATCC 24235 / CBS 4417 / NBRC 1672 / NRRL Y-8282 / UCD 70-5) TaxID=1071381 RepID=G8BWY4_TETPH|nr:hypothetical protein TPHA_0H00790 [Tetrapisispora phaffii CBS 4417]CCE64288.1 hypothetical protein TPHA_0H00790 [Tetrapisispora phaffii CBS 4417]